MSARTARSERNREPTPVHFDPPFQQSHLARDSACAPEINFTSGPIGALGIGCGVSSVVEDDLKALAVSVAEARRTDFGIQFD
jgi:hypothetical protein